MHVRARCLNAVKDYSGKLPSRALSHGQDIEIKRKGHSDLLGWAEGKGKDNCNSVHLYLHIQ